MGRPESNSDIDSGVAGTSARREHERRQANRERRTRERHPHLGGLMLALGQVPEHERAWAKGASGEEHVAARLAKLLNDDVVVLHDRAIPGSRANIDHIAVGPSGVWVIDTKRYKGRVSVAKPLFGSPKLTIAGRDHTKLVQGVASQAAVVGATVRDLAADVPVHAVLCFVDAELPLGGTLSLNGISLLYPRRLAKRINSGDTLAPEHSRAVAQGLARRFPPA